MGFPPGLLSDPPGGLGIQFGDTNGDHGQRPSRRAAADVQLSACGQDARSRVGIDQHLLDVLHGDAAVSAFHEQVEEVVLIPDDLHLGRYLHALEYIQIAAQTSIPIG